MGFLERLRSLFRKKPQPKSEEISMPQPEWSEPVPSKEEPIEPEPTPKIHHVRAFKDIEKSLIAQQNIKRRRESSYKYSKFFKRRQPTTARKLWKADKKPED